MNLNARASTTFHSALTTSADPAAGNGQTSGRHQNASVERIPAEETGDDPTWTRLSFNLSSLAVVRGLSAVRRTIAAAVITGRLLVVRRTQCNKDAANRAI